MSRSHVGRASTAHRQMNLVDSQDSIKNIAWAEDPVSVPLSDGFAFKMSAIAE